VMPCRTALIGRGVAYGGRGSWAVLVNAVILMSNSWSR
jgi:hypothetical protein